jgi:hypothetical protein
MQPLIAQLELCVYRDFVAYLNGNLSISDFRKRFDHGTWDEQIWKSNFLGQIELALAELSNGDRNEQEFRQAIELSFPNVTLELEPLGVPCSLTIQYGTGSTNKIMGQVAIAKTPDSHVGKLHEAARV